MYIIWIRPCSYCMSHLAYHPVASSQRRGCWTVPGQQQWLLLQQTRRLWRAAVGPPHAQWHHPDPRQLPPPPPSLSSCHQPGSTSPHSALSVHSGRPVVGPSISPQQTSEWRHWPRCVEVQHWELQWGEQKIFFIDITYSMHMSLIQS